MEQFVGVLVERFAWLIFGFITNAIDYKEWIIRYNFDLCTVCHCQGK